MENSWSGVCAYNSQLIVVRQGSSVSTAHPLCKDLQSTPEGVARGIKVIHFWVILSYRVGRCENEVSQGFANVLERVQGCNLEGLSRNIYPTLNEGLRDRPLTRFQHSPFYYCCKY